MSQIQKINLVGNEYKLTASQIVSDQGIPGYTTTVPTTTAEDGSVAFVLGGEVNYKIVRLTSATLTSGAYGYLDSFISSNSKVFIQPEYISGNANVFFYTFIAQPTSGRVNIYVRDTRSPSSLPANGSTFSAVLLIIND